MLACCPVVWKGACRHCCDVSEYSGGIVPADVAILPMFYNLETGALWEKFAGKDFLGNKEYKAQLKSESDWPKGCAVTPTTTSWPFAPVNLNTGVRGRFVVAGDGFPGEVITRPAHQREMTGACGCGKKPPKDFRATKFIIHTSGWKGTSESSVKQMNSTKSLPGQMSMRSPVAENKASPSSPVTTKNPVPVAAEKVGPVAPACSKCVKAKRACSGTFPCTRCVKLEQEDGCVADGTASKAPAVEEEEPSGTVSCTKCILGKKECSGTIPCARCVKLELEDSCVAAKAASSSKLV